MHDIKSPAFEKHNHLESIELRYEKITWSYKDGNIIHADSWNERASRVRPGSPPAARRPLLRRPSAISPS